MGFIFVTLAHDFASTATSFDTSLSLPLSFTFPWQVAQVGSFFVVTLVDAVLAGAAGAEAASLGAAEADSDAAGSAAAPSPDSLELEELELADAFSGVSGGLPPP